MTTMTPDTIKASMNTASPHFHFGLGNVLALAIAGLFSTEQALQTGQLATPLGIVNFIAGFITAFTQQQQAPQSQPSPAPTQTTSTPAPQKLGT